MNLLEEYSYIWQTDKDKYVLLRDELGNSILFIKGKEIMFFLNERINLRGNYDMFSYDKMMRYMS